MYSIVAISRAERFSPNSVEKDAAILESVVKELRDKGCDVALKKETELKDNVGATLFLSMGRLPSTLSLLSERQDSGAAVVNSAASVELCCNRRRLNDVLAAAGVPLAPSEGNHGYWLKRADGVAESKADVQYAANKAEAEATMKRMLAQGMGDVIACAHVEGDLLKFYGVRGTDFFRYYYPGDDGDWKFDDEARNGMPQHYDFNDKELADTADRAAQAAGLDVYGGDCIVSSNGKVCIIDLNDWPSFSRCRTEAAKAIAERTLQILKKK